MGYSRRKIFMCIILFISLIIGFNLRFVESVRSSSIRLVIVSDLHFIQYMPKFDGVAIAQEINVLDLDYIFALGDMTRGNTLSYWDNYMMSFRSILDCENVFEIYGYGHEAKKSCIQGNT